VKFFFASQIIIFFVAQNFRELGACLFLLRCGAEGDVALADRQPEEDDGEMS